MILKILQQAASKKRPNLKSRLLLKYESTQEWEYSIVRVL